MHYDVGTLSLWIGVGVALIVGGIQAAGWRHRALIIGLIALGSVCVIAALTAPLLTGSLPSLGRFMTQAAGSPASWITLLLFVAALVIFSGPKQKPTPGVFLPLSENGVPHISTPELGRDLRSEIRTLAERIASIEGQIAIDLPNASTVAEAYRNLDQAVHAKVSRIGEQTQGFSGKLNQDNLDLKHLLYFAALQATEGMLLHLLGTAPKIVPSADESSELNPEAFAVNTEYLKDVSSALNNTNRWSDYRNVMFHAEGETDRRLGILPRDQWPVGINPVELRRYFIAALQRRGMIEYLEFQLREVRQNIRNSRHQILDRYAERDKSLS